MQQRRDPRAVGLERQGDDVAHQPGVLAEVLRLARRRPLARRHRRGVLLRHLVEPLHALLRLAHRRQVLVELLLVGAAHLAAQVVRLLEHVVEDAALELAGLAAEQAVERQRRVQFDRHRRVGVAPRDVRGVHHRVLALVEAADRLLAAEHEARQGGLLLEVLGQQLVHADAALDRAAALQGRPGEDVAGAAGVAAVALPVEQAVDDVDLLLERRERLEARTRVPCPRRCPSPTSAAARCRRR